MHSGMGGMPAGMGGMPGGMFGGMGKFPTVYPCPTMQHITKLFTSPVQISTLPATL